MTSSSSSSASSASSVPPVSSSRVPNSNPNINVNVNVNVNVSANDFSSTSPLLRRLHSNVVSPTANLNSFPSYGNNNKNINNPTDNLNTNTTVLNTSLSDTSSSNSPASVNSITGSESTRSPSSTSSSLPFLLPPSATSSSSVSPSLLPLTSPSPSSWAQLREIQFALDVKEKERKDRERENIRRGILSKSANNTPILGPNVSLNQYNYHQYNQQTSNNSQNNLSQKSSNRLNVNGGGRSQSISDFRKKGMGIGIGIDIDGEGEADDNNEEISQSQSHSLSNSGESSPSSSHSIHPQSSHSPSFSSSSPFQSPSPSQSSLSRKQFHSNSNSFRVIPHSSSSSNLTTHPMDHSSQVGILPSIASFNFESESEIDKDGHVTHHDKNINFTGKSSSSSPSSDRRPSFEVIYKGNPLVLNEYFSSNPLENSISSRPESSSPSSSLYNSSVDLSSLSSSTNIHNSLSSLPSLSSSTVMSSSISSPSPLLSSQSHSALSRISSSTRVSAPPPLTRVESWSTFPSSSSSSSSLRSDVNVMMSPYSASSYSDLLDILDFIQMGIPSVSSLSSSLSASTSPRLTSQKKQTSSPTTPQKISSKKSSLSSTMPLISASSSALSASHLLKQLVSLLPRHRKGKQQGDSSSSLQSFPPEIQIQISPLDLHDYQLESVESTDNNNNNNNNVSLLTKCFGGSELVDWIWMNLRELYSIVNRNAAVYLCQQMMDYGVIVKQKSQMGENPSSSSSSPPSPSSHSFNHICFEDSPYPSSLYQFVNPQTFVLNSPSSQQQQHDSLHKYEFSSNPSEFSLQVVEYSLRLLSHLYFVNGQTSLPSAKHLKSLYREQYCTLLSLVSLLRDCDIDEMSDSQHKTFWINCYNLMFMHSLMEFEWFTQSPQMQRGMMKNHNNNIPKKEREEEKENDVDRTKQKSKREKKLGERSKSSSSTENQKSQTQRNTNSNTNSNYISSPSLSSSTVFSSSASSPRPSVFSSIPRLSTLSLDSRLRQQFYQISNIRLQNSFAYEISHQQFTLADIQYAILRHHLPLDSMKMGEKIQQFPPKFHEGDERNLFVRNYSDPLITFGLCNGTRASPLLTIFQTQQVDTQLSRCAKLYIKLHVEFDYTTLPSPFVQPFASPISNRTSHSFQPHQSLSPTSPNIHSRNDENSSPNLSLSASPELTPEMAPIIDNQNTHINNNNNNNNNNNTRPLDLSSRNSSFSSLKKVSSTNHLSLSLCSPPSLSINSLTTNSKKLYLSIPHLLLYFRSDFGTQMDSIIQWICYHLSYNLVDQSQLADFITNNLVEIKTKIFDFTPSLECFLTLSDDIPLENPEEMEIEERQYGMEMEKERGKNYQYEQGNGNGQGDGRGRQGQDFT